MQIHMQKLNNGLELFFVCYMFGRPRIMDFHVRQICSHLRPALESASCTNLQAEITITDSTKQ
jgi:hypothetical protein